MRKWMGSKIWGWVCGFFGMAHETCFRIVRRYFGGNVRAREWDLRFWSIQFGFCGKGRDGSLGYGIVQASNEQWLSCDARGSMSDECVGITLSGFQSSQTLFFFFLHDINR